MVRGRKFFTTASIVAMSLMFASLMFGFIEDGYYYSYYYYSYWYSFADYCGEWYWPLFGLVMAYIALGVVAIALYNKRITAINIVNMILTCFTYAWSLVVAIIAICWENVTFGVILLSVGVMIAFPLHFVATIVGLSAKKKPVYARPAYQQPAYQQPAYQQPTYQKPTYQQPAYQQPTYQQPAYQQPAYQQPAPTAPTQPTAAPATPATNDDAIEMLKRLKDLYESGVLTEEEYIAKRKQYLYRI